MKKHSPMKKQPAFTLTELMITIAIIAILATAGILAYADYTKKSRDTARAQIAQNLNSSVMAYAASNEGNPPGPDDFTEFLASAGETFGGVGVTGSGTLVVDPVGGKEVCLDADENADEPCRFDYTAYSDGTYAISYGVEHKSSTEGNFYKTTASVVAKTVTDQSTVTSGTHSVPKYGVYTGSAPFIGQPATQSNGDEDNNNDGVDQIRTNPVLVPVFRSIKLNRSTTTGVVSSKEDGETCTSGSECKNEYCGGAIYDEGEDPVYKCTSGKQFDYCINDDECIADCTYYGGLSGQCSIVVGAKLTGAECDDGSECQYGYCNIEVEFEYPGEVYGGRYMPTGKKICSDDQFPSPCVPSCKNGNECNSLYSGCVCGNLLNACDGTTLCTELTVDNYVCLRLDQTKCGTIICDAPDTCVFGSGGSNDSCISN